MQNLPYLFATYAIVWLVLFGYLFVVAAQVRTVRRDLDPLTVDEVSRLAAFARQAHG